MLAMSMGELRQLFVLANDFKEGDLLVGGTRDARVRGDARRSLAAMRLREIIPTAFVDDGVSVALERSLDPQARAEVSHLTVGALKELLLSPAGTEWLQLHRNGLGSEVIAAVVKVMTNDELSSVARAVFNPLPGEDITIGSRQHFGSRIQPNSPGDDEDEILFSILEGLTYGCGDVIIGLNPASDDVETIVRLEDLLRRVIERLQLPTRYCVLSDIVKQASARLRTPVDVGFQSLAGTSKALKGMIGLDADGVLDLARGFQGLYFETGQGSAVTNAAAEGVDMVTLEARAYGLARYVRRQCGTWMIVNDVAGFIGPEVFRTVDQLSRACLEDAVMAKLHGLTMGLDVCATFHMGIAPTALRQATERIVEQAAPAYLMAVAGNADPMLGYLTTSFREHPRIRRRTGRNITTVMQKRLVALGVLASHGEFLPGNMTARATAQLYAMYLKAGGDLRTADALREEGESGLERLRAGGLDLGYGSGGDAAAPPAVETRMEAIYAHARCALYAVLDDGVIKDVSPHSLRVRTKASDREEYLAQPPSGELIRDEDVRQLTDLRASRVPQVQLVFSDGLNADALNENLRAVLPPLRRQLAEAGFHVGGVDVVIQHGRVRAGYHVGALLNPEAIIHFIGERPGTGLNTLSAYLTYGRDPSGRSTWSPNLDHSATTAVCGIHRQGKTPTAAVEELTRLIRRMLEMRCSGVALGKLISILHHP